MYLPIPVTFFVPVYYVKNDIFTIKRPILLHEYNFHRNFTNETINPRDNNCKLLKEGVMEYIAPNDATAGAAIQASGTQGLAGKVIVTGMDADLAAAQMHSLL